ncbi:MAG: histidine ammonia-lyase [Candidatus Uhrbacteria bacterium]|nr:histidine ammonia-lyase [Candidatus Uhrbacteria bacterium]
MSIILTGSDLTIEDVVKVARHHERVKIAASAEEKLQKARDFVDRLVDEGQVVYGVTTGFGQFKNVVISKDQTTILQTNLIRSHATGVGEPLSQEDVRASILVRINSLLQGHSGVRPIVIERLVDLLNDDIYPFVPCKGSVGSSGDLAPLSHIMLVIMGEGEVIIDGKRKPSIEALNANEIEPIQLISKEGLALNNGTSVMTGIGALGVYDAKRLAKHFDIALGMSLEVMMGTLSAYDPRVHALRPHPGQIKVAENVRKLCADSEIMASHKDCGRVQDAYSLRCAPQVHGASRNAIAHIEEVVTRELNSVTDNPLLFPDDNEAISAGHFHGEPIAQVMDYLKIAVAELANISERRIAKMVDPSTSEGLPAFLIPEAQAGLSSGFMIPQYVAAALVSENKVLAHPACVDSIPTSANQEDHVSMGTIAARQAREMIQNAESVAAIEMIMGTQGVDLRSPLVAGRGTRVVHEIIRRAVPELLEDRIMYKDIETVQAMIKDERILRRVEDAIGEQQ